MQTSRDIVRKSLLWEKPDRVPRQMWILPWAEKNYSNELISIREKYPDDIISAPNIYKKSPVTKGDPYIVGQYIDEWGCVFKNVCEGIIGEVKEPLIKDISDLNTLCPPYDILPNDLDKARNIVDSFCEQTDKFVMAKCCPRPWERMQFLCGTVNSMMDIMMPEKGAKRLLNKIHEFYMKELEFWVSTEVDAIVFMDDWGSQNSLLIPPDLWQQLFKPLYKDYCDIAHENGKFAFMHSDGYIFEIYPHLIEVGVDAINSQIFCMDLEKISKIAKGKITFWGEIDRQHILTSNDTEQVKNAVRKVAKYLYDPEGGIIAQFEFGPGTIPRNAEAVFEQWENIK